jgi:hypothetical protein
MKLSTLQMVLRDPGTVASLAAELEPVMQEYQSLQNVRGASIPIRVDQDAEMEITLQDIHTLCILFLSGQLTPNQLAYAADAMELSEGVSYNGSPIADYISEMTDPKVNGVFTQERAEAIRNEIRSQQGGGEVRS